MKRVSGFTLVELMVAVGILAVLGVAASTLLGTTLANQTELRERNQALEDLALSLTILRRDLEQISYRRGRDMFGDQLASPLMTYPESEPLRLEFSRFGKMQLPGSFAGSSLERVRYRLEQGELIRQTAPVPEPLQQTDWRQQRLLKDVDALRLEYFVEGEWQSQWPPLDGDAEQMPPAVAVIVTTRRWGDVRLQVLLVQGLPHES